MYNQRTHAQTLNKDFLMLFSHAINWSLLVRLAVHITLSASIQTIVTLSFTVT